MAYAFLPLEVLASIFSYLHLSDRLAASLVCKQWYFACLDSRLMEDFAIVLHDGASEGMKILMNTNRSFPCLILKDVDVHGSCIQFWRNLGQQLSVLEFHSCDVSERVFIDVLAECKSLQKLSISACNGLFISGTLLERPNDIAKLEQSLQNVKELNLSSNRYLSDSLFSRLIQALVNLEKLSLAGCQISFHPGIFKRFYPRMDSDIPSSSVFTFQNIMKFITKQGSKITSLNFSRTLIDNRALKTLVGINDMHLTSLSLISCEQMNNAGILEICECQPKLSSLDLSMIYKLKDDSVEAVCEYLPELRELCLRRCHNITDSSVSEIRKLKKLERLDISSCEKITPDGFQAALCNNSHPNLKHLNLSFCHVTDDVIINMAPHVANITHLDLSSCLALTDKSLQAVSLHLVLLRTLKFSWCREITDRGLIGHIGTPPPNFSVSSKSIYSTAQSTPVQVNPILPINVPVYPDLNALKQEVPKENAKMLDEYKATSSESKEVNLNPLSEIKGLRELDLCGCVHIGDTGLKRAVRFIELKYLNLSLCQNISDEGLIVIGQHNPSLEILILSQCYELTDYGIDQSVLSLRRLKHLDLQGCKLLTDATIYYLANFCRDLRYLDVSLCHGMTLEAVEYLESTLSSLHTVHKRHLQSVRKDEILL